MININMFGAALTVSVYGTNTQLSSPVQLLRLWCNCLSILTVYCTTTITQRTSSQWTVLLHIIHHVIRKTHTRVFKHYYVKNTHKLYAAVQVSYGSFTILITVQTVCLFCDDCERLNSTVITQWKTHHLRGILPRGSSACISCIRTFWKSTNLDLLTSSKNLLLLLQAGFRQVVGCYKISTNSTLHKLQNNIYIFFKISNSQKI